MITLEFERMLNYESKPAGIIVPVRLGFGNRAVSARARMDTGASDCLFGRAFGEELQIEVESGYRRSFRTVAGGFHAFGHEVELRVGEFEWTATVYFFETTDLTANFLGRTGWLDRVLLGLNHYEQQMYLAPVR